MHLQHSADAMQASHLRVVNTVVKERMEINGTPTGQQLARALAAETAPPRRTALVPLPPPLPPRAPPQACTCHISPEATEAAANADLGTDIDPNLLTLARMIEAITGMRIRVLQPKDLQGSAAQATPRATDAGPPPPAAAGRAAADADADWGLVFEREVTHTELDSVSVQARGQVHTADGRTLRFQLDVAIQSMQSTTLSESLRLGNAKLKDPLVIHFDGPVGELRHMAFRFDLDADGTPDRIPFVGTGSGFLALDANGNGQIDDGRELFGTQSGDGFADLAKLDADGNGWIDQADPAFAQLSVWRMDAAGHTRLQSLESLNVGALYLGRVASDMALRDTGGGQQLGQLRSTGLYLTTAGQAGALQQIDLVA
jgi:hypothetical protein